MSNGEERISVDSPSAGYKVKPSPGGCVEVIYVSRSPAKLTIYRTVFYGPDAQARAVEYADWKNQS